MRPILIVARLMAVCGVCVVGRAAAQGTPVAGQVEVTGKLTKVMAIGGETTGWAIEMESEQSFGGKPLHSIEVEARAKKLEKLENKKVTASGIIVHRPGVENKDRSVLQVEKIKEWKPVKADRPSNY